MIARLAHQFGSPGDLWKLPIGMLKILDKFMPRLEAERLLSLHSVLLSASGRMQKQSANQLINALTRQASDGRRERSVKPKSLAQIAGLGIAVEAEIVEEKKD